MEFEDGGSIAKVAPLALEALGLDVAELDEGLLELAGEALAVEAKRGEQAVGVHDVERRGLGAGGWGLGAREYVGFEKRDPVEAPRGVGEFVDQLDFSGSRWTVFIEELAVVLLVGGRVFGGEDGGAGR
jgi:hypothetical protein